MQAIKVLLPERRFVGLSRIQRGGDSALIGQQWGDFNALAPVQGAVQDIWYGVMFGMDTSGMMTYFCGQEVPDAPAPLGMDVVIVPAGQYGQFQSNDPVATIGGMWGEVMSRYMGSPDWPTRDAPMLEVYAKEFDIAKGVTGFAILIPTL